MAVDLDPRTFRGRLRIFAKEKFGTLKRLAEEAGLNYGQVVEYSDDAPPSGPTLKALAAIGADIGWLLTGVPTKRTPREYGADFDAEFDDLHTYGSAPGDAARAIALRARLMQQQAMRELDRLNGRGHWESRKCAWLGRE